MLSSVVRAQKSSHKVLLVLSSHCAFCQSLSRPYVSDGLIDWERRSGRSTVAAASNSFLLLTAVWRIRKNQRMQSSSLNTLLPTLEMYLWHTLRFVKVENSGRWKQAWIISFVPRISRNGGPESKIRLFFEQFPWGSVFTLQSSFHSPVRPPWRSKCI